MEKLKVLTSADLFGKKFTFGQGEDYNLFFQLQSSNDQRPEYQDTVAISVSLPFDKETFEDINAELKIPRDHFEGMIKGLVAGKQEEVIFESKHGRLALRKGTTGQLLFKIKAPELDGGVLEHSSYNGVDNLYI